MFKVNQITADAAQVQNLVLPDGTIIEITIEFKPMQYGWFITKLLYGNFELHGMRIYTNPNILNQYSNQIPFGLACATSDNGEPKLQQDFSSGYASLYILDAGEVAAYARFLSA